jgi:tetratricopeptide (TPR) repeat protein
MRAIGQALGASHLIEGSVRKEGNALRITAQLVKADDGRELWSESYDRELKGVFALQEEIAKAIAGALRVPLGLQAGQSLVASRTRDTKSYQDYLQARALFRGRGGREPGGPLTQAAKLLEQVVARDPDYAPAWAMLAQVYVVTPVYTNAYLNGSTDELRRIIADDSQKAEGAVQQATRLDPNNADPYAALGIVRWRSGRYVEAEDLLKQALSLDPGNPDALNWYSLTLASVGRVKEALGLSRRLRAQEPLVPQFNRTTAINLWRNGRNDEAVAIFKALPPTPIGLGHLAGVYASMGRYNDAAETLRGIPSGTLPPGTVEEAVRLLRAAPTPVQAASSPTMLSRSGLGWVYLYVGAPERALDFSQGQADAGVSLGVIEFWAPAYAPVRKTERFKALVRKMGLVDYWRARGWPEYCRPDGDDDFACS